MFVLCLIILSLFLFCGVLAYGLFFGGTSVCSMVFFLLNFFPFFSVNGVTRTCILGNAGRLKLLGFFTTLAVASLTIQVLRTSLMTRWLGLRSGLL